MSKKIELQEGQVFYPRSVFARHPMRRIVGIVNERVFYSVGGDRNFHCKRDTFLAWRGELANPPEQRRA